MSKTNPKGRKLEELLEERCAELQQVRQEVQAKNDLISNDPGMVAAIVRSNNARIDNLLSDAALLIDEAKQMQLSSIARLATIAPDPGPEGTPRIGGGENEPG